MVELTEKEKARIAELFKKLDVDKDGRVSITELTRVIRGTTDSPENKSETAQRIIGRGTGRDEECTTLTFSEFLTYVRDTETQLKLAFRQLDKNHDNCVDVEEIQSAMRDLGLNVGKAEAEMLLQKMDKDGSLKIDYNEWRDFLLFSGSRNIDEIFRYWRRASAIDIGESVLIPDDFTEEERKSGEAWKTLLSGGVAGCISRTATAPLDRIKVTWQALGGKASDVGLFSTVKMMLKEGGVTSLWRGNGVSCLKIAPESAIKFQAYEMYKEMVASWMGQPLDGSVPLPVKFVSGALAGATSQTIIYPMEVLKTRMCLRKSGQYTSIFDCARQLYRHSGWQIFYRGYVPNLLGILPYAGIDLALYETFKQMYARRMDSKEGGPSPVYVSLAAGAMSSVCGQVATYPLALVRTKMQAQTVGKKTGFLELMSNIVKHEGFTGLFRGLGPNMLKVIPAVSISYASYEEIRKKLHINK